MPRTTEQKRANGRAWYRKHREERLEKQRAYYRAKKEYYKKYYKEYDKIRRPKRHKGFCTLCLAKNVTMYFDHDHKTGEYRGFICNKCNLALGLINDSVVTLKNMIAYLQKDYLASIQK